MSTVMSCSGVRGRTSSRASVRMSRSGSTLAVEREVDERAAVAQRDLAISPTLTPATVATWPWPGRQRLAGRHLDARRV